MFVSGALLVTGTTVATVIGTTGRAVRRAGTGTREVARTVRTQRLAKQPDPWGDAPGDEIAIKATGDWGTTEYLVKKVVN